MDCYSAVTNSRLTTYQKHKCGCSSGICNFDQENIHLGGIRALQTDRLWVMSLICECPFVP
eukprot:6359193-Amphidinium_carterae.1